MSLIIFYQVRSHLQWRVYDYPVGDLSGKRGLDTAFGIVFVPHVFYLIPSNGRIVKIKDSWGIIHRPSEKSHKRDGTQIFCRITF